MLWYGELEHDEEGHHAGGADIVRLLPLVGRLLGIDGREDFIQGLQQVRGRLLVKGHLQTAAGVRSSKGVGVRSRRCYTLKYVDIDTIQSCVYESNGKADRNCAVITLDRGKMRGRYCNRTGKNCDGVWIAGILDEPGFTQRGGQVSLCEVFVNQKRGHTQAHQLCCRFCVCVSYVCFFFPSTYDSFLDNPWSQGHGHKGSSRLPPIHALGVLARIGFSTHASRLGVRSSDFAHAFALSTAEEDNEESISPGIEPAIFRELGHWYHQFNHRGVVAWTRETDKAL